MFSPDKFLIVAFRVATNNTLHAYTPLSLAVKSSLALAQVVSESEEVRFEIRAVFANIVKSQTSTITFNTFVAPTGLEPVYPA